MEKKKKAEEKNKAGKLDGQLMLSAVGDVFIGGTVCLIGGRTEASDEKQGAKAFDKVLTYFHNSDFNFCNLEGPLSKKGKLQPGRSAALRAYPGMVKVLKKAEIDFVSLANNHIMDYGWEGFADTIKTLSQNGIGFSGGGKNIEEARKPAIVEKKGLTVGLLSYTANVNVPLGFQAAQGKPGLAPVRISPFFSPDHTNKEDIEALQKDIQKCREMVDFVIVSFHWGVSEGGTHTIALHQQSIAHHAIDAGADLILGHHPHAIQGVELYRNKLICYSLGHFAFAYFTAKEGFPRETMLFQCRISRHKVHEAGFLPAFISKEGQPEILSPDDRKGLEIVSLMRKLCADLGTKLIVHKQTGEIIFKSAAR